MSLFIRKKLRGLKSKGTLNCGVVFGCSGLFWLKARIKDSEFVRWKKLYAINHYIA